MNVCLYHRLVLCIFLVRCFVIASDYKNVVQYRALYLKRRLQLYSFALLALRPALSGIILDTGSFFQLYASKCTVPEYQ